jgi:uracil-DNA glycosylase
MQLHGSTIENLTAAVESAGRLRGHPVYKETATVLARPPGTRPPGKRTNPVETQTINFLAAKLQSEIADCAASQ